MKVAGLGLLLFVVTSSIHAHDFWIEPSTFRPAAGKAFSASLRVGQDFLGDPVPRSAELMDSFVVRDASGERPVIGFENRDPAGFAKLDGEGAAVIGYRSKASTLDGNAEKFAQFLRDEGITGFAPNGKYRERFFRYAKTVVISGKQAILPVSKRPDRQDCLSSTLFGYRLELIPSCDLSQFRLLFENKPLPNALVTAIARHDGRRVSARTNRDGRVTLALPHGGVWLVKSTHLVAAPPGSGFDWESLWASVTFER